MAQKRIRGPRPTNSSTIESIASHNLPILTTNYDELVESVCNRAAATWLDSSAIPMILTSQSTDILHLHGTWRRPDSIVLGAQSYGSVLASKQLRTALHGVFAAKTVLFVGFGDGLADSNFAELRKWASLTFPQSEAQHYRLCRAVDESLVYQEHDGDNITPVVYGEEHSDLQPSSKASFPTRPSGSPVSSIPEPPSTLLQAELHCLTAYVLRRCSVSISPTSTSSHWTAC